MRKCENFHTFKKTISVELLIINTLRKRNLLYINLKEPFRFHQRIIKMKKKDFKHKFSQTNFYLRHFE